MTPQRRTEIVKSAAKSAGFDLCGIAPAEPIPRAEFLRQWLTDGNAGTMGYLHRHTASRIDVRAWLPATRSVIVVALNYRQPPPEQSKSQNVKTPKQDGPVPLLQAVRAGGEPPRPAAARGRVAMYAWGEDYHVVMRDGLERLVRGLRDRIDMPFEARICVDTSAVIERELAAMAGLGWIGKNTLVLHPRLGSFFFLGEIITDLPLTPDAPQPDHCGTCTRCLDACPTDAFRGPYVMDPRRCISYLTIEHRGDIDADLAARMGDWVFGCDVCQDVCPFNAKAPHTDERRLLAEDTDDARPSLDRLRGETESQYKSRVAHKAQDRARFGMWKRNAEIARRNLDDPHTIC